VFLTILQVISAEVYVLIRDQVWINVGAYDPKREIKFIWRNYKTKQ